MKKSNFSQLIREELVKRFEGVVRNEINSYQNAQTNFIKKLEDLGKELQSLKNELQFLKTDSDKSYNDIITKFVTEKKSLKEEFDDQRRYIKTSIAESEKFIKEANEKIDNHVAVESLNDLIHGINEEICYLKVSQHAYEKMVEKMIYEAKVDIIERLEEINSVNKDQLDKFSKIIDDYKTKVSEYYVSNEGFLRELNCHKRVVFIQEKKIENLYTLIDRLDKRII